MPSILTDLSRKIRARIPERRVCLAPGHVFFTASFELPDGLDAQGLESFAELSLEGAAPFPVDQLAWGYLTHPGSRRILCFGTPTNRLKALGIEDHESFYQSFPGFIIAFGRIPERATTMFVYSSGAVSALIHDAGDPVPRKVISAPVTGDIIDAKAIAAAAERLRKRLPAGSPPDDRLVWAHESTHIEGNGKIRFSLLQVEANGQTAEAGENALSRDPAFIWAADLRDRAYSTIRRRNRALSAKLWKATVAAGYCLAFLVLFQLVNWGGSLWIQIREARVRAQSPQARFIQDQMDLADRLVQSANEDIRPIDMLSAVNQTRPAAVYFTRARSERFDQLRIEGRASNVQTVNDYARSLEETSFVGAVENNPQTRGGETEFEMVVSFGELPAANEPVPEPTDEEGES